MSLALWCGLLRRQGDIGLNVAQMLVELIRDNRKIVDRITQDQIRMFVDLLRVNKVSLPLTLLYISESSLSPYSFYGHFSRLTCVSRFY